MDWKDVTAPTPPRMLRQFAVVTLVVLGGVAARRAWRGDLGAITGGLAFLGVVIGVVGLWRPRAIRVVYVGAMALAFPIGWTVSRLAMAVLFFLIVTPVALLFRACGRDPLRIRQRPASSYWQESAATSEVGDYFRQS
jgi:Saxitoxin biosynthesis operon protein SxtJ